MSSLQNTAKQLLPPLPGSGIQQPQSAANTNALQVNSVPTGMPAVAQAQLAPQVQGNSAIQSLAQAATVQSQQNALQQQAQQLQQQQAQQRQAVTTAAFNRDNTAIANSTLSPGQGPNPYQQYAQWYAAQQPGANHQFVENDMGQEGTYQGPVGATAPPGDINTNITGTPLPAQIQTALNAVKNGTSGLLGNNQQNPLPPNYGSGLLTNKGRV